MFEDDHSSFVIELNEVCSPFVREGVKQAVHELTDVEKLFKYEKEAPLPHELPPPACPCGDPACTINNPPGSKKNYFGDGFKCFESFFEL